MCGISGGWWTRPSDQLEKKIQASLDKMEHRGPDDNGYVLLPCDSETVVFGHTRLSIIDLSSGGHQPMLTPDSRYTMVFNGEIYNYLELRGELQEKGIEFTTQSDSEVLLQAFIHWGKECLQRLDGMFAFIVFDTQDKTLFCARDPFGIKPLFYRAEKDCFVYSSELPSLLALCEEVAQPNLQRAYDYLVYGEYDSNSDTFIDGVKQLRPAQYMTMKVGDTSSINVSTWWRAEDVPLSNMTYEQAVTEVRTAFLDSVRLQLRSDVPLGVALSGGIDSSSTVCAMRKVAPEADIHTFSFVAEDSDLSEEKWVDRVNAFIGGKPNKVVATGHELANDLDKMIKVQGEPFGSTSIYAQYRVFCLAKAAGITVTLDGQGADELLAGYDGYPGQRLKSLLDNGQVIGAVKFLNNWRKWPNRSLKQGLAYLGQVLLPDFVYSSFRQLSGKGAKPAWLNMANLIQQGVVAKENRIKPSASIKGRRVTSYLKYTLSRRNLPALLRHADRNAMAFSIESRVPFLTLRFAELLLSLPEPFLISDKGETKHVFRDAMRGIVPDDVLDRRDKLGFSTPEKDWLMGMKETVRRWLNESENIPFINTDIMLQEFDQIIAGEKDFSWQVWRWVNYCRWYKLFIERQNV